MDLDFSDQDLAFRALIATTFPSGSVYDEAIWHAAQAVGPDWAQAEVTRYLEGRAASIAAGPTRFNATSSPSTSSGSDPFR